jgi:hypothetical protein
MALQGSFALALSRTINFSVSRGTRRVTRRLLLPHRPRHRWPTLDPHPGGVRTEVPRSAFAVLRARNGLTPQTLRIFSLTFSGKVRKSCASSARVARRTPSRGAEARALAASECNRNRTTWRAAFAGRGGLGRLWHRGGRESGLCYPPAPRTAACGLARPGKRTGTGEMPVPVMLRGFRPQLMRCSYASGGRRRPSNPPRPACRTSSVRGCPGRCGCCS